MSEMIDYVAKELCRYRAKNPVDGMSGAVPYEDGPALDEYVARYWQWWQSDARAAIEAMRKPTEEMLSAGRSIHPYDCDVGESWPVMIDAALGKQTVSWMQRARGEA